ncbi:MAG TPA: alpha/beta hydrolase, partial [Jatrophihabitans sp.]|nr:alpha/beta hydrolase [Jatrophihabitans sp.]
EAALNSPHEVRGLVLLCPAVAFRKLRQLVPFVRILPDELAALPVRIPRRMAMRGVRGLFADASRLPDTWYDAAIDEFVRVLSIRPNRLAIFSALRHIYLDEPFGEAGFWDRLPALEPPALFVWGQRDVLVPAAFARFVAEALPNGRSVVLPDCGHVPQFEHPERTGSLVRDFLAGLD